MTRRAPLLALVGVTAIWGVTFVQVQDAIALYPLFAFLAVRFAISTVVLAPFAWRSLRTLPRSGYAAGIGVGRPAGDRVRAPDGRARADDGREHRLHHRALRRLHAAARARVLRDAACRARCGRASALAVVGLLLLNGVPGGSTLGNALVLGNAIFQAFQITAMERFAPRYDPRALTFLQMTTSFVGFTDHRARARRARGAARGDRLGSAARHGRLRGRTRLPDRDVGAGADDGGACRARVHARGAVRGARRRPPRERGPRLGGLARLRGDDGRDPRRGARRGGDAPPARLASGRRTT